MKSNIANGNNFTFSLFPDFAVEASFTHKGVRFYLYVGRYHVEILNFFLGEKANDVAFS